MTLAFCASLAGMVMPVEPCCEGPWKSTISTERVVHLDAETERRLVRCWFAVGDLGGACGRYRDCVPKHKGDFPSKSLITPARLVMFLMPASIMYENVAANDETPHEAFVQ